MQSSYVKIKLKSLINYTIVLIVGKIRRINYNGVKNCYI